MRAVKGLEGDRHDGYVHEHATCGGDEKTADGETRHLESEYRRERKNGFDFSIAKYPLFVGRATADAYACQRHDVHDHGR